VISANSAAQAKPSGYSIALYYSHSNLIYHNTFANTLLFIETRNSTRFTPRNSWDNGLEGNYWNSYEGVDANQDGTGDTPFIVGENNVDNHPLMGKFVDFTVALGEKAYSITIISNSTISQFQFSPEDGTVSFVASGFNRTIGFSRIAVPNALLQDLQSGNLTFLINWEQPVLQKKWTDGICTYWYFSYVNSVSEPAIIPWLIVASVTILLIASLLVLLVFKKKHWISSRLQHRKGDDYE
jgi:hypothetical protein